MFSGAEVRGRELRCVQLKAGERKRRVELQLGDHTMNYRNHFPLCGRPFASHYACIIAFNAPDKSHFKREVEAKGLESVPESPS